MSKKPWAPPQKGTELFPVVGQLPIRLLVKGVPPGSPQEARLVADHQGVLSQFITKQRHAYSLSTIPIQKGRIERDGVSMTYMNQQGMETATLEVRPTLKRVKQHSSERKPPWDWALVTINIPDAWSADLVAGGCYLQRVVPAPTEPGLRFGGRAYSDGSVDSGIVYFDDGRNHPVTAWAPYTAASPPGIPPIEIVSGAAGDDQLLSVKFDLDQFAGAAIVADVYGYLAARPQTVIVQYQVNFSTPISSSSTTSTVGTTVYTIATDSYSPALATFWPYAFPSPTYSIASFPTFVDVVDMPAGLPAPTMSTNFVIDELVQHDPSGLVEEIHGHIMDLVLIGSAPGTRTYSVKITDNVTTYPITSSTGSVPGSAARSAEMRAAGGFGVPDWQYSRREIPSESWPATRWEWGNIYPRPVPTSMVSASVPIASGDAQLLGRLIVDPARYSISFKPA